jgi:hypothetical protein
MKSGKKQGFRDPEPQTETHRRDEPQSEQEVKPLS